MVFLLQSDEELVQQVKKEKQEFASVQSKLKIFEVFNKLELTCHTIHVCACVL